MTEVPLRQLACPRCHGETLIERAATPEEVDAGCELGVAYDRCPCTPQSTIEAMAARIAPDPEPAPCEHRWGSHWCLRCGMVQPRNLTREPG